ncbi:MAG: glycosyltransferase [Sulfuritalea sp.]|nr:glycosyltransferase [Sulfuritalea sp.]
MIGQAIIDSEDEIHRAVDVICSAKNGGAQFAETISSVLNQTFRDFRFVIVDDGSDDGETARIADDAAARDGRVSVHHNAISLGLTANLVKYVDKSKAEFIGRIDAGDMWLPDKLEKQVATMSQEKNIVILGTQCDYVTPDGRIIGRSRFGEDDHVIRKAFKSGQGIFTHSSILFRRRINYRLEFRYSQDLDLYLRASELGRLYCMREPLTLCLISPDGLTLKRKYLQRKYQALAYRSHFSRTNGGKEVDLRVTDGWLERFCWNNAMPFYHRYINARTNKQSVLVWGAYLAVALILFPPLLGDYLRRL